MSLKTKSLTNFDQVIWYLLLISLFFNVRVFLDSAIFGFHEYEALFLYLSDIFLILLLALNYKSFKINIFFSNKAIRAFLIIFVISAFFSIFLATSLLLASYAFVRLLLLIGFAGLSAKYFFNKKVFKTSLVIIAVLVVFQASLAIAQFSSQKAIGFALLGESPISAIGPGTSTVAALGGRLIRGYGLFPHPNILAGFLLFGLIILSYLYINLDIWLYKFDFKKSLSQNFKEFITNKALYLRVLLAGAIFITIFGLAVSFSRSAWLGAAIGLLIFAITGLTKNLRPTLRLLTVLLISSIVAILILLPIIKPRAQVSINEQAVNYRLIYNQIGVELVKNNPLGVGISNSVFNSVKNGLYQDYGLNRVYQWEPIHNLYLLAASEIGVIGSLSFVGILLALGFLLAKKSFSLTKSLALSVIVSLLVIGLFDHFLWDLQPGKLLLWLSIGLSLAVLKNQNRRRT